MDNFWVVICESEQQTDVYIRQTAGGQSPAIAGSKQLLDSGTITQAEYDKLGAKALA